VPRFRLTVRAEVDLLEIAAYTQRTWDDAQCDRYLDQLEQACERLAEQPGLGRGCDHIRPRLHRSEQGKHVIFYRRDGEDIVVVRILHERMLPALHLLDEGDE
jgi:toxin ParE1/3/4